MFDIGFSELLLFGVIALIVLGPEKLPQAARTAGQWYAKIRRTVSTLQSEIEAELDLAETRQQMQKELAKIRETEAEMRREMAEMRGSMQEFESSQNQTLKATHDLDSDDRNNKTSNNQQDASDQKNTPPVTPKAFDYAYGQDEKLADSEQLLKHGTDDETSKTASSDNIQPITQIITTKPWENMWFRLGAYDKARRLPQPPYLPNYKADVLLNSYLDLSLKTQASVNKQETD
ncbi:MULTISPECIES: Sec-independent protein translocase protein TatB [unclassified Psychrobacter]|jgi:sec-independent protein translocase protein TatB|uniref:Sec-independent protein translocase protein TatB n=1 Tax=unclassified Psychrobacter TaxID=196806 RepID=UPI00188B88FB|nr:Sec-independent protein translocase protein TatB [Psychrobacter sp. N25K4-3-2]MBF4490395.1 twin-arginine translocase subunit TatB [Psychrobacter sp. N25K4-3-2]